MKVDKMYNPDIHNRQSTRLKGHDYSGDGKYFITICTKNREEIFGDIKNGTMILNKYGTEAKKQYNGPIKLDNHLSVVV
jgi:putative transposase